MKNTRLVAFLLFATHLIYSQETISASGGNIKVPEGSSSYSVGQLVYNYSTGGGGTITQGVQQSFEIITLSNPELKTVNLSADIYPNPTTEYVVLVLTDTNLSGLRYTLYDVQGKLVTKGLVTLRSTQIDMQSLNAGSYILKINQINQELKTFKIIKK